MREIEFRAWEKYEKRMVHTGIGLDSVEMISDDSYEVMQYTGLKDKNGKKLYDGDILDTPFGKGKITWEAPLYWLDPSWTWVPFEMHENGFISGNTVIPFSMVEVIGNVFENYDLVGKK